MKTRYAIKIALAADDWIYVTEPSGTMFEVTPVLFNSRKEAEEHAAIWGVSKVVRYRKETT
jgi:hypothetical protein